MYTTYLALFSRFARTRERDAVPDTAYFAAYEAARGAGDALLASSRQPTTAEVKQAVRYYERAVELFPFDRQTWALLFDALARRGAEQQFDAFVERAGWSAARSAALADWIEREADGAPQLAAWRSALADAGVRALLGFASDEEIARLDAEWLELSGQRDAQQARLVALEERRSGSVPAAIDPAREHRDLAVELAITRERLGKLGTRLEARSRAVKLYRGLLAADGLARELARDPDHPAHSLLRQLYLER
jgi:hypothetical protein